MFERYTLKARRCIFFARFEASLLGRPSIETEHLLLGILREDSALVEHVFGSLETVEAMRDKIEARATVRENIPLSADLPLSLASKRALDYAAEEAERMHRPQLGTGHLLLGLLREETCFAAEIRRERGGDLAQIREDTRGSLPPGTLDLC